MNRSGWRAAPSLPAAVAALCAALSMACTPAIDWREMQPAGAHLALAMPCRPANHERSLLLAGVTTTMRLHVCEARQLVFAIGHADVGDPARVASALVALGAAARANIDGHVDSEEPAAIPGMTPHAQARQWRLSGRLPDGRSVVSQVIVFAYGTRVYQASVVGTHADEAAMQHFAQALAVRP